MVLFRREKQTDVKRFVSLPGGQSAARRNSEFRSQNSEFALSMFFTAW
jgi:hypothetical protein